MIRPLFVCIFFLLTLVGCESPPDRSIPLMYGTVIDKGNLSGTVHEEARIVNGKFVLWLEIGPYDRLSN